MRSALSRAAIESELVTRFGSTFKRREKALAEVISTGIPEVDSLLGGLPRGAITEIFGPASSGRTSLPLAALAFATTHDEVCALVDTSDVLDLTSAANAGIDFDQLLWIRCASNVEHAFKATDLLLQGGGFGLVLLDMGDVPPQQARRIISSWWYRFRRVVENTPTAFIVIAQDSCVRSCATLTLEMKKEDDIWTSVSGSPIPSDSRRPTIQSQPPGSGSKLPSPDRGYLSSGPYLLRSIQLHLNRQRPIQLAARETQFRAAASV
jgi:recombination protein RecA